MKNIFAVVILLGILSYVCPTKNYTNYLLFRSVPRSSEQVNFLVNLSKDYDINFWREPLRPHFTMEFSVSPGAAVRLYPLFGKKGLKLQLLNPNIQRQFDGEIISQYESRRTSTFNWLSYFRLDDIYAWIKDLQGQNQKIMEIINLGKTSEGRDILAVKIKYPSAYNHSRIVIEAGIHARERISVAFATYLINDLIHANNTDADRRVLQECEWYIVPCLNPDGYEYTFTSDRLWRKNRRNFSTGIGVDLNRNFDANFASTDTEAKSNANSEVYPGPGAFSEKETSSLLQLVERSKKIDYYIAIHAYGQLIIIPYAYSVEHFENYNRVYKECLKMSKAIRQRYGTSFECGTAYDTLGYMASGVAADWMKKTYHVPYAISMELRDKGSYGFSLPSEFIIPTSMETLDGLIYFLRSTKGLRTLPYRLSSSSHVIRSNYFFLVIFVIQNIFIVL